MSGNNTGWAISTGAKRPEITDVSNLKNSKVGVSRIGSGSYVMSYVLADQQGWLASTSSSDVGPFKDFVVLQTFDKLRAAVNDGTADFFMWEHFTSKKYYDSGEIRRVGEIYTPWPSWKITASTTTVPDPAKDRRLRDLFTKLDQGVKYFGEHQDEAVQYISTALDYSKEDATEWLKTVRFCTETAGVNVKVIDNCIAILRKAGVLQEGKGMQATEMLVSGLGEQLP